MILQVGTIEFELTPIIKIWHDKSHLHAMKN